MDPYKTKFGRAAAIYRKIIIGIKENRECSASYLSQSGAHKLPPKVEMSHAGTSGKLAPTANWPASAMSWINLWNEVAPGVAPRLRAI
jgi:hypothetical protein